MWPLISIPARLVRSPDAKERPMPVLCGGELGERGSGFARFGLGTKVLGPAGRGPSGGPPEKQGN
jgi:hypothetical protein